MENETSEVEEVLRAHRGVKRRRQAEKSLDKKEGDGCKEARLVRKGRRCMQAEEAREKHAELREGYEQAGLEREGDEKDER